MPACNKERKNSKIKVKSIQNLREKVTKLLLKLQKYGKKKKQNISNNGLSTCSGHINKICHLF